MITIMTPQIGKEKDDDLLANDYRAGRMIMIILIIAIVIHWFAINQIDTFPD